MKLHLFMGQEPCAYEGENAPEVLVCWDEFCVDNAPDLWEKSKAKALADRGGVSTFEAVKEVIVDVPDLDGVFEQEVLSGKVSE